jgi:hypothetical protein
VRRRHGSTGAIRAFQLTFVDESGRLAFETTVGVRVDAELVAVEPHVHIAAASYHRRALASIVAEIAPWLELSRHREEAIVRALRDSHARLSAGLLQPGLFDRRAERAAAAQAARVDEAMVKSRVRLDALDQLRRLHCGERRLLFEIRFRP